MFLRVSPEEGAIRNKKRRICEICGIGILGTANISTCPICQGKLKIRIDDSPKITKKRIEEYNNRTMPILKEAKKRGIKIIIINGEQPPYKVFADIMKKIK